MDHDDPERRIADIERGQAGVWAPQPAPGYVGTPAGAAPPPSFRSTLKSFLALKRQQRFPKWLWLGVAVWALGMFVLVGVGVHDLHQYRSGRPVVATIVKCQSSGKGSQSECTVRWYEDGKAYTAQLHRVDGRPLVGSRVDVGVKGDDAYAATSGRSGMIGGSIGIGVILAVSAFVLLNRRRKRQREYR